MITNVPDYGLAVVYFFYGLAFFCMGFAIILERDRSTDERLRLSLRPLAAFGVLHGINEWMDLFELLGGVKAGLEITALWYSLKLAILAFSFLSLAGFGFSLLAPNMQARRLSLLAPLVLAAIWGFGMLILQGHYVIDPGNCRVACVWTRYSLGIPSALMASIGLIAQQRTFRKAGMAQFGRDSLVASIAFAWYGIVGQLFVPQSRLPPSTFLNQDLFYMWFGFPIQILRAVLAVIVAIFVIRFMRAFDTEIKRHISELQILRLREAQRRETLRGGLLKRVVAAQEAERQRIARELHDDTGQTLTAIALGLRGANSTMKFDVERATNNLSQLESLTTSAIEELQRVIANLRPAHLDDLGLPAALRWYLKDTKKHTDAMINFRVEGEEIQLPDEVKIAIYRIVQEGITNIIKHAQASRIIVILTYDFYDVKIMVEDNGIGMDLEKINNDERQSWGLLGIEERATLLNGTFNIESQPGQGTSIQVSIPYLQPEEKIIEDTDDYSIDLSG